MLRNRLSSTLVTSVLVAATAVAGTALVVNAAAGDISTFAGDGTYTSTGDGGPATSATMKRPHGITIDAAGNIYVSDELADRIRKIDTSGNISTYAGDGNATYAGDGGQATSASMETPYGIVFDAAGNLYISDMDSDRVRKVTPAGVISTYAGDGSNVSGGDGGQATSAGVRDPNGLAVDSAGNLYIVSRYSVRKVNAATGIISTIAGTSSSVSSGDGGPATSAQFVTPRGLAFDPLGNLYITDSGDHVVRKIDTNGNISTFAGTSGSGTYGGDGGPATSAQLNGPRAITFDSAGNAFIADTLNNRIRKVDTNGIITTVAGDGTGGFAGDGGTATGAQLSSPFGVLVDAAGNLYIADRGNSRVRKVSLIAAPAPTTTTTTLAPTTTVASTTTAPRVTTTVAGGVDDSGTDDGDVTTTGGDLPETGTGTLPLVVFAAVAGLAGLVLVSRRRLVA